MRHFRAALLKRPEAMDEIAHDTIVRYLRGDMPRAVRWLMRHPDLLRALAQDAEEAQAQAQAEEKK